MKIKDAIKAVLATGNAKEAGRIADAMRFGRFKLADGTPILFNYNDMIACVARCTGRTVADVGPEWENLLIEADAEDARS